MSNARCDGDDVDAAAEAIALCFAVMLCAAESFSSCARHKYYQWCSPCENMTLVGCWAEWGWKGKMLKWMALQSHAAASGIIKIYASRDSPCSKAGGKVRNFGIGFTRFCTCYANA